MRETTAPTRLPLILLTTAAMALVLAALALSTMPALILVFVLCVTAVVLVYAREIPAVFLGSLGVVVLGYAFLGRSFAYLGVPPLYIGEMTLCLGLVAGLLSGSLFTVLRSPVAWLILITAAWGAVRTVPYVHTYGLDALRDATLWGYSAFALVVAACVLSTRSIPTVTRQYEKWIFRFAAWGPAGLLIGRLVATSIPNMPGTDIPLLSMKPGDSGVHLAGAAAFMLLGLYGGMNSSDIDRRRGPRLFWVFWLISLSMVTALNRGGFLAVTAALVVVGALAPMLVGRKLVGYGLMAVAIAAVVAVVSLNLQDTTQVAAVSEERAFSPNQVIENVLSIVGAGETERGNLSSTKEWRLEWWTTILDYTVFGRYFWQGKGFGINLADDDGFQVALEYDAPLRSPHNVYMTALARMGVPGALLWVALQICFGVSLVLAYWRARTAGSLWWARLNLWILGYWCAFLVNASFDVFLEGPQGGIPFWSLIGLGIAALEWQRSNIPVAQPARMS